MNTTKPVIRIIPIKMKRTRMIVKEPVLTNSSVPPIALGKPATMPAKIIKEIPLPMPFQ